MSLGETIFLFVLALIVFGPKKLPEIARQVGRYLNEFRRASNEFKAQIEQEISHLEREESRKILPPSDPPAGATSRGLSEAASETEPNPPGGSVTLAATPSETAEASHESDPVPPPATEAGDTADQVAAEASQESHA
jgi:sec-independent protein translocase protein TatB